MKPIIRILLASITVSTTIPAFACLPLPPERYAKTEKRVRERFDNVDSVMLVTLLEARKVKFKEMEIDMEGEEAIFRVDRTFKGRAKPGDKLTFLSYSTCARSVLEWDSPHGPIKLSRQWIIYRNESDRTEITYSDMTQPLNFASYDLKVLQKIAATRTYKKPRALETFK